MKEDDAELNARATEHFGKEMREKTGGLSAFKMPQDYPEPVKYDRKSRMRRSRLGLYDCISSYCGERKARRGAHVFPTFVIEISLLPGSHLFCGPSVSIFYH